MLFSCIVADRMTYGMPWKFKFRTEYYFLILALVDQILIVFIICVKNQDVVSLKSDKLL